MIGGTPIKPGETVKLQLEMPPLYTSTQMAVPVYAKRSKRAGPTLVVCAAIHGDELNGIEIVSRLINARNFTGFKGTLIAVPMVNVYGVLNQSRYLPDRRDLNRSFPGSKKGSLAARLANLFLTEVIEKADVVIDLHTGAIHRSNLPQIRGNLDDPEVLQMAEAFGVPVLLNSDIRDGSLRFSATEAGAKVLVYEAGQALRFDELSVRAGYSGVINVMRHLNMLGKSRRKKANYAPFVAKQSGWVRAPESGFLKQIAQLGDHVEKGHKLASISDPFGTVLSTICAPTEGVIIGKQNIPLAHEGEAIYHIAYFSDPDTVADHVERLQDELLPNVLGQNEN